MEHHAPLAAATHDVAQRVEKFPQRIVPLGRIFLHQHQMGTAKVPFCIADVTGIGGSWLVAGRFHPKLIAWPLTGVQHLSKFITASGLLMIARKLTSSLACAFILTCAVV